MTVHCMLAKLGHQSVVPSVTAQGGLCRDPRWCVSDQLSVMDWSV